MRHTGSTGIWKERFGDSTDDQLTLQQTPQRHPVGGAGPPAKAAPSQINPHPENVTPEFLRWLCKTLVYTPAATAKNSLGIAGFANEFSSPLDLRLFMDALCEDAVDATYTVQQVYGDLYDPSHPGYEASLDVQLTGALAYTTPVVYYYIGGNLQRTSAGVQELVSAGAAWHTDRTDGYRC